MDNPANSSEQSTGAPKWHVLRVTYNRAMAIKEVFDEMGLDTFVPMQYREMHHCGRLVKRLVPVVSNLLFVRIDDQHLRSIKASTDLPIRYFMDSITGKPLVVPEKQMNSFIAVSGSYDEQIMYLGSDLAGLHKGQHVRVLGGVFEGTEGYIARIKGDRRVVVEITGVMAVATTFIHPSLLQVID